MPRTEGFKTKEEAAEAWNTWAGIVREITCDEFNKLNDDIIRDYPIENGKLIMPDGEHAFGDLVIVDPGGYQSPWPRIYMADYSHSENGYYENDIFSIYKLRSRWRLIEQNHQLLKRNLKQLICENDQNNEKLNAQLSEWNDFLADSGFPLFSANDLRGVDLSGMVITSSLGGRVNLRNVDLSYSECHLLTIENGNLYNAKFVGAKGVQLSLNTCTCHGCDFTCSYIPNSKFLGTDLAYSKFNNGLVSNSIFNGANCHGADFSSSLLLRVSFGCAPDTISPNTCANLKDVKWDQKTRFEECYFNEFLREQNIVLYDYMESIKNGRSVTTDLIATFEAKPGLFGFSIDLKGLVATFKKWVLRKNS